MGQAWAQSGLGPGPGLPEEEHWALRGGRGTALGQGQAWV